MMRFAVAGFAAMIAIAAWADPPAQAPAHGWRKKHDPEYVGYTGTRWERDFEISSGHCNREEIGAVLGGAVGGAIGSQASGDHRAVATLVGVALGALVGSRIGRELDDSDRGCFGHALELGQAGRPVVWVNPRTGVNYTLTPGAGEKHDGKSCRNFVLRATADGKKGERRGKACRTGAGEWNLS